VSCLCVFVLLCTAGSESNVYEAAEAQRAQLTSTYSNCYNLLNVTAFEKNSIFLQLWHALFLSFFCANCAVRSYSSITAAYSSVALLLVNTHIHNCCVDAVACNTCCCCCHRSCYCNVQQLQRTSAEVNAVLATAAAAAASSGSAATSTHRTDFGALAVLDSLIAKGTEVLYIYANDMLSQCMKYVLVLDDMFFRTMLLQFCSLIRAATVYTLP
jgi:hypothetical protein